MTHGIVLFFCAILGIVKLLLVRSCAVRTLLQSDPVGPAHAIAVQDDLSARCLSRPDVHPYRVVSLVIVHVQAREVLSAVHGTHQENFPKITPRNENLRLRVAWSSSPRPGTGKSN